MPESIVLMLTIDDRFVFSMYLRKLPGILGDFWQAIPNDIAQLHAKPSLLLILSTISLISS